ncbi:MAG: hypothetical protein BWY75_00332 [bacterium ADurb.Bin425]|nr:MAG: hypothetical protein BWY75_00332 [bacterium ADurb.Bin425]
MCPSGIEIIDHQTISMLSQKAQHATYLEAGLTAPHVFQPLSHFVFEQRLSDTGAQTAITKNSSRENDKQNDDHIEGKQQRAVECHQD